MPAPARRRRRGSRAVGPPPPRPAVPPAGGCCGTAPTRIPRRVTARSRVAGDDAVQGVLVQRRTLALGSRGACAARGLRAVGHHRRVVAGLDGMVHDARQVDLGWSSSAASTRALSCIRAVLGSDPSTAAAGELVSEAMASWRTCSTPNRSAAASRSARRAATRASRQLDPRRHDGQLLQRGLRRPGPAADPGEGTASTTVGGTASAATPSASETKNGLPPVSRYNAAARCGRPPGQPRHRGPRQPVEAQPVTRVTAQSAQHPLQRMAATDLVVAIGHEQHRGQVGDPPSHVAQHVERRLVGPVHILHHQHGRLRGSASCPERPPPAPRPDPPASAAAREPSACARRAAARTCAGSADRHTPRPAPAPTPGTAARRRAPRWSYRSPPRHEQHDRSTAPACASADVRGRARHRARAGHSPSPDRGSSWPPLTRDPPDTVWRNR